MPLNYNYQQPFEKYQDLFNPGLSGRPNGRPVGVANGMGQRPNVPSNPMLAGLKNSPTPVPGISPIRRMNPAMQMPGIAQGPQRPGMIQFPTNDEGAARDYQQSMAMRQQANMQQGLSLSGLLNQMNPDRASFGSVGQLRPQPLQRPGFSNANAILDKYGMGGMRGQLGY